jgi:hypothetical protein
VDIAHIDLFFYWNKIAALTLHQSIFGVFSLSTINNLFAILLPDQRYKGKSRIYQHSGSMITAKGNMERMLKEHEKNIQEAVRKARLNKSREL